MKRHFNFLLAALLFGLFGGMAHAKVLPKACFLSDGTLVNALSGKVNMEDPVSGLRRHTADTVTGIIGQPIAGLLCNPKKLQVLVLHEYDNATKSRTWGVLNIQSQQVIYSVVRSMAKVSVGVHGKGLGLVFSTDGEMLAGEISLGYDDSQSITVFDTTDFSVKASVPTNRLLPSSYNLIAVNAMEGSVVEVLGCSNRQDSIWQFPKSAVVQKVRWDSATSRVERVSTGANLTAIAQGNNRDHAFWDSAPGLGSFFTSSNYPARDVYFLNTTGPVPPLSARGLISYGVWMTGKDEAIVVGQRYRPDGNTREDSCGNGLQTYRMKAGATELEPIGSCNAIDPRGEVAIDTQRGLLFNTSANRPDRVLKLPDFSDPQEAYAKTLQGKYNVAIRTTFTKSNPKERYVPSVSNSKTYSETLFYVGGQPVTRYQDHVTTQSGYSETVEMVDLVYEIRNNHVQPLSIRFRVDRVAQGSSWQVKTLGGGFWQGMFGGRFSSENVRERESLPIPVRLVKTVVLQPGEAFKSKDVWGERPARAEEMRIFPVEIQEVDSAWLKTLRDLLDKRVSATEQSIAPYLNDPNSSWAKDRLQTMQREVESATRLQRSATLARAVKLGAVSVPKEFDVDFPTDIAVDVLNQNAEDVEVDVGIAQASTRVNVPARGRATAVVKVQGVAKQALVPRIVAVR